MAGGDIYCGSWEGEDKSGSAYSGVLDRLEARASDEVLQMVRSLKEALEEEMDHVEIVQSQAVILEPLLSDYRKQLVRLIGHDD